MSINLLPDIRRPMLVKIMWIFYEENVVGVNLELAVFLRANRSRVIPALHRKNRQHLLYPRSPPRNIGHHILNRKLLQRQQQSRLMPEIRLAPLPVVWIVRELIT